MYRITVKTAGKFHNVALGPRYCFRKKTAKNLIKLFMIDNNCEIIVEKFCKITNDVFCWVDDDEGDSVFNYVEENFFEED